MKTPLKFLSVCLLLFSCTDTDTDTDTAKQQNGSLYSSNTRILDYPRPDDTFRIAWIESSTAKFRLKDTTEKYPNLSYDSARIFFYKNRGVCDDWNTNSLFALNEKGHWINLIMRSTTVSKNDLIVIDSLLGHAESFDSAIAAIPQMARYAIVYFDGGLVTGQTTIGDGSQTVSSTFKLGNPASSKRLNDQSFTRARSFLWKHLDLEGLARRLELMSR